MTSVSLTSRLLPKFKTMDLFVSVATVMLKKVLVLIKAHLILLLIVNLITAGQSRYKLKHEGVEVSDYNAKYLKNPKINLVWYNRSTRAFSGSTYLINELGTNLQTNVTIYKFVNLQYRYYPVEFKRNFCEYLRFNLFGAQDIAKLANVTNCPISPGYYSLNNIVLDISKFPPYLIPNGRYKIRGSMYDSDTYVGSATWQGEIEAVVNF